MSTEKPNSDIISYSNFLDFEGRKLAFRKQELFDITGNVPLWIPFNKTAECWIVKRKQLSRKKAKEIIVKDDIKVNVSDLQWYEQEQLNHVFNLC
jgi:hypothetical protein